MRFDCPSGRPALRGVSLVIEPGKSAALVGANGAGRSMIIKLLCRFYDATRGQSLINGVDLRELDPWTANETAPPWRGMIDRSTTSRA